MKESNEAPKHSSVTATCVICPVINKPLTFTNDVNTDM